MVTRELINEILESIGLERIEHDYGLDDLSDHQHAGPEQDRTAECNS